MPLSPSRRDILRPPKRDLASLASIVRHLTSYLHSVDPGILEGRFATPSPVPKGPSRQLVGGDAAGDDTDYAWEYDDRHTITATGTQTPRLSHIPIDETLHVFWHPGGNGGLRVTSEHFTIDDQVVTIPDPGYFAVGDTFSFQYEYEVSDDVLEFEFIAAVAGVFAYPANTLTFTPPAGMQAGDFLVVATRGASAAGGGDLTLDVTTVDPRISRIYAATPPVVEAVFTGFATSSTSDVVTNVVPNPSWLPGANGVMGVFRGVNAVETFQASELAGSTPTVPAVAAVAVTWDGNNAFSFVHVDPPTGYTDAGASGLGYSATDISYWFDPAGDISPAGTFTGEGCLVIGLI